MNWGLLISHLAVAVCAGYTGYMTSNARWVRLLSENRHKPDPYDTGAES